MSGEFGKLLKEFRTNKKISQSNLAESLSISRNIVSSWEDGSGVPSRVSIKDIAKILKLNPAEIDKILISAGYGKLSGNEILEMVRFNLSGAGLLIAGENIKSGELSNFFNSTGTVIGGTIGSLDEKINAIENTLGVVNSSITELRANNTVGIAERIENEIKPLTAEVNAIKNEIVPKLEETRNQLSKSDEFLRKNADFFISAVEGEGAIKIIKTELISLEKRLDKVENQLNISRDRVIAIAAAIFALLSACVACASLAIPIYQLLKQP